MGKLKFQAAVKALSGSGGASSETSERHGGGGDFDVVFQSKGIPN